MTRSFRSILKVFAGVTLAVAGSLLLLEQSARIFLFGFAGLDPRRVDSVHAVWEGGFMRVSSERALGYELKPDVDGFLKLARFRTNSRGLRDREYTLEKPPDTFRVAVLGSSFAMPAGVAIEDAFHSLLEERLTRESSSLSYEFINFAVAAYGPRQVLATLRLRALAYDPDLVLFAVTRISMPKLVGAWDRPLPPPVPFPVAGRPDALEREPAFFDSFLVKLIDVRLGRTRVGIPQGLGPKRPRPEGIPSIIQKLGELSRAAGIPAVVVRLEIEDGAPSFPDRAIENRIRAEGLYFVDTRSAFAGITPRDVWLYEVDPHPNARAHALFADVVATFLRENGLLEFRR